MQSATFIDNAKVMSKGQVTIPKDVRNVLGVENGDHVTFIVENGSVRLFNSATYAMMTFQNEMKDEAKKSMLSEDDIAEFVTQIRKRNK